MSKLKSRSSLGTANISFDEMINQFGVVTVMNVKIFTKSLLDLTIGADHTMTELAQLKAHDIIRLLLDEKNKDDYISIDSLKIANINFEGSTKTVNGGQYNNALIKFGKTATIEMQDALGRANVLEQFGVSNTEIFDISQGNNAVVHIGTNFTGPMVLLGESFFIDQKTGAAIPVHIILYQVLPDSVFNLTQDSEGDATVFDLNGALLSTTISIGSDGNNNHNIQKGVFYSILPKVSKKKNTIIVEDLGQGDLSITNAIVSDDNNGNLIWDTSNIIMTDDGQGNITIK